MNRILLVILNCVPVFIFTDLYRSLSLIQIKSLHSFYALAAIVSGNMVWLFIHKYFVENLKQEMQMPHIETVKAYGLNYINCLTPKIKLLILNIVRPLFLILTGVSIFIEKEFIVLPDEFTGISYWFYYDFKHMTRHDVNMILGVIFSIILISTFMQFFIVLLKYKLNPGEKYEK